MKVLAFALFAAILGAPALASPPQAFQIHPSTLETNTWIAPATASFDSLVTIAAGDSATLWFGFSCNSWEAKVWGADANVRRLLDPLLPSGINQGTVTAAADTIAYGNSRGTGVPRVSGELIPALATTWGSAVERIPPRWERISGVKVYAVGGTANVWVSASGSPRSTGG